MMSAAEQKWNRKAGMHIFRQNDAYEKVLRPGVELSTQSLEE